MLQKVLHWKQVTDIQPQLNEFEQRVVAGYYDESAPVIFGVDQNYLWERGQRELLRRLYATIKGKINNPRLSQQVNRRAVRQKPIVNLKPNWNSHRRGALIDRDP